MTLSPRFLTSQSRSDVEEAVAHEDPDAIASAIPYWGTEDAILSAVVSDAQIKVRLDTDMLPHTMLKD